MDYKQIGENIYAFRKAKRFTQKQLAEQIDRAESTIQKYEKGDIEIPNSVLQSIAVALDVTYNNLVDWNTQEIKNEIITGISFTMQNLLKSLGYKLIWQPNTMLISIIDDNENVIYADQKELGELEKDITSFVKYKVHELFENNSFLG